MAGNNGSNATQDFLRNYAAGGGTVLVQQPNGQYVPANANNAPALQRAPATTPLNQNAQAGGGAGGSVPANQAGQTRQQQQQQQGQQRQRDAANKRAFGRGANVLVDRVGGAASGPRKHLAALSEMAGRVPTPGGIGMLLIILLVFISAIVAVNQGLTRLQLAWLTILNQTYIPESQQATAQREQPGANNSSSAVESVVNSAIQGIALGPGGVAVGIANKLSNLGSSGVVAIPANGQLPIAGPMPSTGVRS